MDDSVPNAFSEPAGGAERGEEPVQGTTIGDYTILGKIGAGGGGQVYKAEHRRMERIVALKLLPTSTTPHALKRFQREVKAAAKLIHPNIVTAFDAGEHGGTPYLVMQYVEGRSLAQVVEENGPLPVDTACDFIIQAGKGLAYAHSRGIVHRDIKPSNLMVDSEGVVKILDMGLARYGGTAGDLSASEEAPTAELTKAGTVIGTVAFMSPEQTKDAATVDHRTDIYSLGCTFYYLLTAQPVYSGDLIAVLLAHAQQPIPSLRSFREDVPERLDAVYQRMLAKQPEDRYQTINEVIADLEQFIVRGPSRAASAAPQLEAPAATETPWATMLQEAMRATQKPSAAVQYGPAVGIDLGTSWSAIAHIDKKTGKPVTLANAAGDLATPSAVMIDGSNIVIGKGALEAADSKQECIADCIKRDLGRNLYHKALGGQHFPPEVLLALLLNKLVEDARRQIGDFKQVVIAVPAYFGDVRRRAVQDAAQIAGLELLDLVNEPTAVAAAFGRQHGWFPSKSQGAAPRKILICDIGGGAFDVSLIQLADDTFSVLAIDGKFVSGGRDWDERLAQEVARMFNEEFGLDPRQGLQADAQLRRKCESTRCTLSDRPRAPIKLSCKGKSALVEITRRHFEKLTRDLADEVRSAIKTTLRAAGVRWAEVDHLLLVGGLARTPMLRQMIRQLSGKEPDTSVSVKQAVAHGAALHAAARLAKRQGQPPSFQVEEVNAHSMGIVATDARTRGKCHAVLIPRNTRLPASAKRTFKTHKPGQDALTIQIVQGESKSLSQCTWIGKCVIENLPPDLPAGTPFTVELRCTANGQLTVFAESDVTGQRVTKEIRRPARLSPSELAHWREWVETMALCVGLEGEEA